MLYYNTTTTVRIVIMTPNINEYKIRGRKKYKQKTV